MSATPDVIRSTIVLSDLGDWPLVVAVAGAGDTAYLRTSPSGDKAAVYQLPDGVPDGAQFMREPQPVAIYEAPTPAVLLMLASQMAQDAHRVLYDCPDDALTEVPYCVPPVHHGVAGDVLDEWACTLRLTGADGMQERVYLSTDVTVAAVVTVPSAHREFDTDDLIAARLYDVTQGGQFEPELMHALHLSLIGRALG